MKLTSGQLIERAIYAERQRITALMRNLLCFDYLEQGWCEWHGGKCQDLDELKKQLDTQVVRGEDGAAE
jgi:hypothetical protein